MWEQKHVAWPLEHTPWIKHQYHLMDTSACHAYDPAWTTHNIHSYQTLPTARACDWHVMTDKQNSTATRRYQCHQLMFFCDSRCMTTRAGLDFALYMTEKQLKNDVGATSDSTRLRHCWAYMQLCTAKQSTSHNILGHTLMSEIIHNQRTACTLLAGQPLSQLFWITHFHLSCQLQYKPVGRDNSGLTTNVIPVCILSGSIFVTLGHTFSSDMCGFSNFETVSPRIFRKDVGMSAACTSLTQHTCSGWLAMESVVFI